MNEQFLHQRKENHLNTCFNIRKNKLKEISKANQQIYKRINSQNSLYSSRKMDEKYQETNKIRNRLSQSKLSQRLSDSQLSRKSNQSSSSRRSQAGYNRTKKKEVKRVEVKATDITRVSGKDLRGFEGLFSRDINVPAAKSQSQTQKGKIFKSKETTMSG